MKQTDGLKKKIRRHHFRIEEDDRMTPARTGQASEAVELRSQKRANAVLRFWSQSDDADEKKMQWMHTKSK